MVIIRFLYFKIIKFWYFIFFYVFRFFPKSTKTPPRLDYITALLRSSRYYRSMSSSKLIQRKFNFDFFSFRDSVFNQEVNSFSPKNKSFSSLDFESQTSLSPRDIMAKSFIPQSFLPEGTFPFRNRDFWASSRPHDLKRSLDSTKLRHSFSSSLESFYPSLRFDNSFYHSDSLKSDFSFQNSSSFDEYFFSIFSRLPVIEFVPHFNILPPHIYDFLLPYFNRDVPWSFFSSYFDPRQQINLFNLLLDSSLLQRFISDFDASLRFFDQPFGVSKTDLLSYSKLDFSSELALTYRASFFASSSVYQARDYFFSDLLFSLSSVYSSDETYYSSIFSYYGAGDFYPFESFTNEFLSDNVLFWKHGSFFHDTLYSPGSKFPYEYNNIYSLYPFLDFSFKTTQPVSFFNTEFVSFSFYEEFALSNLSSDSLDEEIFIEKNLVLNNGSRFQNKFFFQNSRPLIERFARDASFSELGFSFSQSTSDALLDPFDYTIDNIFFFQNSYRLHSAQYDIFSINFESRLLDFNIFFDKTNSTFLNSFSGFSDPIFFSYDFPDSDSKPYDFWFLESTLYDRWSVHASLKPQFCIKASDPTRPFYYSIIDRYASYDLTFGLFDPFDSASALFPSYDIYAADTPMFELSENYDSPIYSALDTTSELLIESEDFWGSVTDPFDDEDELDGHSSDIIVSSLESNFDEVIAGTFFDQHLSIENFSKRLMSLDGYDALFFRSLFFDRSYLEQFDSSFNSSDDNFPASFYEEYELESLENNSELFDTSSFLPYQDFSQFQVTQRFSPKAYNLIDSDSELFKNRLIFEKKSFKRFTPRKKLYTIRNGKVQFRTLDEFLKSQSSVAPRTWRKSFNSTPSSKNSELFFVKFAPSYREYIRNKYFPYFLSNPYAFEVISDWYFQSQFELDFEVAPMRQTFDFFKSFRNLALDDNTYEESRMADFRFPFYENYIYQRPPGTIQDIYTPIADTWIVHSDPSNSKFSIFDIFQLFKDPYTFDANKLLSYTYSSTFFSYSTYEVWRIQPSFDVYPHHFDYEQELSFSEPFGLSEVAEPFFDLDPDPVDADLVDESYWNILYFLEDKDDAEFYSEPRLTIRDLYDGYFYHDISSMRMHITHSHPNWADLHDDYEQHGFPTGFRTADDLTSPFDFTSWGFNQGVTFQLDDIPNNSLMYLNFISKQDSLFSKSFRGSSPENLGTNFIQTPFDDDQINWSFDFAYSDITDTLDEELVTSVYIPDKYKDFFEELVFAFSSDLNFLSSDELSHKTQYVSSKSYLDFSRSIKADLFFFSAQTPSRSFFSQYGFDHFQESEAFYYRDFFSQSALYEPGFSGIPYFSDRWYSNVPSQDSSLLNPFYLVSENLVFQDRFLFRNKPNFEDKELDFSDYGAFFDSFGFSSLRSYWTLRNPGDRVDYKRFARTKVDAFYFSDLLSSPVNDQYDATVDPRLYYRPQLSPEHYTYQGYIKDFDLYSYETGVDEAFHIALESQPALAFDDYLDHDLFIRSDRFMLEEEYSETFDLTFSESQDASYISTAASYDFHDVYDSSQSSPNWFYALHSYLNSTLYLNYQLDRFNTAEWNACDDPFQNYNLYLDFSDSRYRYIDPVFEAGFLQGIHHHFLTRTSSNYIWEQIYFSFEFFIFDFLFSNYINSLTSTVKSTFASTAFDQFQDDFIAAEKTLYSFHYFQFKLVFDEFLSRRAYYYSLVFVRQNFLNEYWVNLLTFFYYYKIFFFEFFPQLIFFFRTQVFLPFDDFSTYKYSSLYYEKEIMSFFLNEPAKFVPINVFDQHWSNSLIWFYAYSNFKSKGLLKNLSYSQFVSFFMTNDIFLDFSAARSRDPRTWLLLAPFMELSDSVRLFNEYGLESGLSTFSSDLSVMSDFLKVENLRKHSFTSSEIAEFREYVYEWSLVRVEEIQNMSAFFHFSFVFMSTTKLHVSRSFYFSFFTFFIFSVFYADYIKFSLLVSRLVSRFISIYYETTNRFHVNIKMSYVVLSSPFLKKNIHFFNSSNVFPIQFSASISGKKPLQSSFPRVVPFFKKATFLNFKYSTMYCPTKFYPAKLHFTMKPLIVFKSFPFYFRSNWSSASAFTSSSIGSTKYHFSSQFSARQRSLMLLQMLPTRFSIADYIKKTQTSYRIPKKFFAYRGFFKTQETYNSFLNRSPDGAPVKSPDYSSSSFDPRTKFNDYDSMPVSHVSYLDWFEISQKAADPSLSYSLFLKYSNFNNSFFSAKLLQKFLQKKTFTAAKISSKTQDSKLPFFDSKSFFFRSVPSNPNNIRFTRNQGSLSSQILFFRNFRSQQFDNYRLRYYYWSYYAVSLNKTSVPTFFYLKSYWNFFFFNNSSNFFDYQFMFVNSRKYGYYNYLSMFKPEDARYLFFTRMFLDTDPTYYPLDTFSAGFSTSHIKFSSDLDFQTSRPRTVNSPFGLPIKLLHSSNDSFETVPQTFLESFSVSGFHRRDCFTISKFVSFRYFMRKLFHRNFSNVYKLYFSQLPTNSAAVYSSDLKFSLFNVASMFTKNSFSFFRKRYSRFESRIRAKLHTRIKSDDRVNLRIRRRIRKLQFKRKVNNYKFFRRFGNFFSHSFSSVDSFSQFSVSPFSYSMFLDFMVSLFSSHFDYDDFSSYTVPHLKERLYPLPHERFRLPQRRSRIWKRFRILSKNIKIRSTFYKRKRLFRPLIYFSDYFTSLDNEPSSNNLTFFNGLVYEPYLSDYKARDRLEFPTLLRSLNNFSFNRFFRRRYSSNIRSFFTSTDYNFRPRDIRYRRYLGLFKKRNGLVLWRYAQNKPFSKLYRFFRRSFSRRRRVYLRPTNFSLTKFRSYVFPDFYSRWLRRGIVQRNLKRLNFTQSDVPRTTAGFFRDLTLQDPITKQSRVYSNFRLNYFQDSVRSNFLSRVASPISYQFPFRNLVRSKSLRPTYYNFAYNSFSSSSFDELVLSFFRSRPFSIGTSARRRADLERLSAYRFQTSDVFDSSNFQASTVRYPWFSKYPFTSYRASKKESIVLLDEKKFDPAELLEKERLRLAKLEEQARSKTPEEIFQSLEENYAFLLDQYSKFFDVYGSEDISDDDFTIKDAERFEDEPQSKNLFSTITNSSEFLKRVENSLGSLRSFNHLPSRFNRSSLLKIFSSSKKLRRRAKRRKRRLESRMGSLYMKNYSYIKMWPNIFYGFYRFSLFPFSSTVQFFNFSYKNFFLGFFVNKYELFFNFIFFGYKIFYAVFYLIFYIFYASWFSFLSVFDSMLVKIYTFLASRNHKIMVSELKNLLSRPLPDQVLFSIAQDWARRYNSSMLFYVRPFIYSLNISTNPLLVFLYTSYNRFVTNFDLFSPIRFFRFNALFLFDLFYRTLYSKVLFSKIQLPRNHRIKTTFFLNWLFDNVYYHFLFRSHFYFYLPFLVVIFVSRVMLYSIRFFIFFILSFSLLLFSFFPRLSRFYLFTLISFFLKMFLNFLIFLFRYLLIKIAIIVFFFFKFFILHDEIQTFGFFFRMYDKFVVLKYLVSKFYYYYRYVKLNQFFFNSYIFWSFRFIQVFFISLFRRLHLIVLWELFPFFFAFFSFWLYYNLYKILTLINFFSIFFRLDFFWSIFFIQLVFFSVLSFAFRFFYPVFRHTALSVLTFTFFVHLYFIYFGFYELYLSRYNRNSYQNFSFLDTYSGWENKLSKLLSNNVWFSQTGYNSYRRSLHRDPSTFFNLFRSLKPQYSFSAGQYFFKSSNNRRRLNTYTAKIPFPHAINFGPGTNRGRTPSTTVPIGIRPYISVDFLVNSTSSYFNSSNYYWNFFNPSVGSVYETYYYYGSRFRRKSIKRLMARGLPDDTRYISAIGMHAFQYGNEPDDAEVDELIWENNIYDAGAQDSMNYIPGFLFRQFLSKNHFSSTYKGYSTSFSASLYNDQIPKKYWSTDFSFSDYDEFMDYDGELDSSAEMLNHDWDAFDRPGLHHSWNIFMFDLTEIQRFVLFRKAQVISTFFSDKFLFFNFQIDFFRTYFLFKIAHLKLIFFSFVLFIVSIFFILVCNFWFWRLEIYQRLIAIPVIKRLFIPRVKTTNSELYSFILAWFVGFPILSLFHISWVSLWGYQFAIICFQVFIYYAMYHHPHPIVGFIVFYTRPLIVYLCTFDIFIWKCRGYLYRYHTAYFCYMSEYVPRYSPPQEASLKRNRNIPDTYYIGNIWIRTSPLHLFFSKERFFRSTSLFTSSRIFSRAHYIAGYDNRFSSFTPFLYSPAINYFGYIVPRQDDSVSTTGWFRSINEWSKFRSTDLPIATSPLYFFQRFYSFEKEESFSFIRFFFNSEFIPLYLLLRRLAYPFWTRKFTIWPFSYLPWDIDYDYRRLINPWSSLQFYSSSNYYRCVPTLDSVYYYGQTLSNFFKINPALEPEDRTARQEYLDQNYSPLPSYYHFMSYLLRSPQDRFYYPPILERLSDLYKVMEFFFSSSTESFETFNLKNGFDFVRREPLYTYGSRRVSFSFKGFSKRPFRQGMFTIPDKGLLEPIWPVLDYSFSSSNSIAPEPCFSQSFRFFRLPVESQFRFLITYVNLKPHEFYPAFAYSYIRRRHPEIFWRLPPGYSYYKELRFNFYPLLTQYRTLFEFQFARIQYYSMVYKNISHINNLVVNSYEFVSRRHNRFVNLSDWGWYKDIMHPVSRDSYETFVSQSIAKNPNFSPKSRILISSRPFRQTRPGPDWFTSREEQRATPFALYKEVYSPIDPKIWHSGVFRSSNEHLLLDEFYSDSSTNLTQNSYGADEFITNYLTKTRRSSEIAQPYNDFESRTDNHTGGYQTFRVGKNSYSTISPGGQNYRYHKWLVEKKFYKYINFHSAIIGYTEISDDFQDHVLAAGRLPVLPHYRPFHRWNHNTFYFMDYQNIYDSLKQYELDFLLGVKKAQVYTLNHLTSHQRLQFYTKRIFCERRFRNYYTDWAIGITGRRSIDYKSRMYQCLPSVPSAYLYRYFAEQYLFSRNLASYQFEKFINWSVYRYFYSNAHQHTVSTYLAYIPYNTPPGFVNPKPRSFNSNYIRIASSYINIYHRHDIRNPDFLFTNCGLTLKPLVKYLNQNMQSGFLFQTNIAFAKMFQNKFILIFSNKFHPSIFLSSAYEKYCSEFLRPSFLYSTLLDYESRSFLYNIFTRYPQVVFGFRKPSISGTHRFYFSPLRPVFFASKALRPVDISITAIPDWALVRDHYLTRRMFYAKSFTLAPYRIFDFSTYPGRRFHFSYYNTFFSSPLYLFFQPHSFIAKLLFFNIPFIDKLDRVITERPLVFLSSRRSFNFRSDEPEVISDRKYYFSQFTPRRLFDPSSFIPYRIYQTQIRQEFFVKRLLIVRSGLDYPFISTTKVIPKFFFSQEIFQPYLPEFKRYAKVSFNPYYFRGTRWPHGLFRFSGVSFSRSMNTIYAHSYDSYIVRSWTIPFSKNDYLSGQFNRNLYDLGNRGGIFSYPTEASYRSARYKAFYKFAERNHLNDWEVDDSRKKSS